MLRKVDIKIINMQKQLECFHDVFKVPLFRIEFV